MGMGKKEGKTDAQKVLKGAQELSTERRRKFITKINADLVLFRRVFERQKYYPINSENFKPGNCTKKIIRQGQGSHAGDLTQLTQMQ